MLAVDSSHSGETKLGSGEVTPPDQILPPPLPPNELKTSINKEIIEK